MAFAPSCSRLFSAVVGGTRSGKRRAKAGGIGGSPVPPFLFAKGCKSAKALLTCKASKRQNAPKREEAAMTDYIRMHEAPRFPFEQQEVDRLAESIATGSRIDAAGVIRWNSNDNVPPQDVVRFAAHLGHAVDVEASDAARERDVEAFMAEYRARDTGPTPEQRAEARAAHGPGVELVDVISGNRWTT